ncbi:MAG: Xaa-Pro peptidase family protein [Bryobacterales bacterium]|nr:Xaa-Pro peptidase family protein [Bryobacteraceae bacterium]MDW8129342.1 Xaa-Pro peptidase family protein [Bryobacterales bacterium]
MADELAGRKLDALVVTAPPNIRYLCGFTGSHGLLVVPAAGEPVLYTDPRYEIQAGEEARCTVKVTKKSLIEAAARDMSRRRSWRRIGFEAGSMRYADYAALRHALPSARSLEPQTDLVEKLRLVKSPAEVETIRRSMAIAAEAYRRVVGSLRPPVRETEVAAELDHQMRQLGAEKPAFETIVLFGERAALPHGKPGPRALSMGDLVLVDLGAVLDGYTSDMTRMAVAGKPTERLRRLYQLVLEAQRAALEQLRPGVAASAVDRAARRSLERHGLADCFVHSTGHGVGLEIHEAPRLGKREKVRLKAGMVVTIEPGIYVEGWGGLRVEDTVVVTSNGYDILTPLGKELTVL